MGSFSIWHWLLVLVVVGLAFAGIRRGAVRAVHAAGNTGGNLVHSITAYIVAALHDGSLSANTVIDRLADCHKARLPELGIDTDTILREARNARASGYLFGLAYLALSIWLLEKLLLYPEIEYGMLSEDEFVSGLLGPLLFMAVVGVAKTLLANRRLRRLIPSFDAPIDLSFPENVIVFGGFSPFAGFGDDLDSWSFTIDTTRPKEGRSDAPLSFTQQEFLDFLSTRLQTNIANSFGADLSFVSGRNIRSDTKFLASCTATPVSQMPREIVEAEVGRTDSSWRHYRSLTMPISAGHVALTFFLRSTNIGKNTFIESRCFILSSIKPEYTSLNDLANRRGVGYHLRLFRSKLLLSPFTWISEASRPFEGLWRALGHARRSLFGDPENKRKKRDVAYNYGHVKSFREDMASGAYQSYFQVIDKDRIAKTVQYITVNSIVDFLDARGIATEEIKERRTQIFNSGVIVSGGILNAQQIAVGSGAMAKISQAVSALKPKGASNVQRQ